LLSEARELEAAAADLVPQAKRGEPGAREELLRRSRGTIYRWALVQTGDAADAEDVTQEVLITMHHSLHRFSGRSRFTTWLYQVTRNEALTLRRRLRRRLRLADRLGAEAQESATPAADPLDRLHATAMAERVRTFMRDLPPRQRGVFALADLEDCSMTEIAERLGTSAVTA
jgi:RNA polymerase sigma-70 factor (ECF subfamily)